MTVKCTGCGLHWNVSIYRRIPDTGYICPHCVCKMREGESLQEIQARHKGRPEKRKESEYE